MRSHIRNQRGQTQGVFFLIGKSDESDQRTRILENEIEKFNDFIIGDYIDAYKNVTKKTFSGYKYVTEQCHHDHQWVLYLDDDTLPGETQHGLDFFYGRPQDSRKLLEFLQHISPVKYKTTQKLIGHDVNNATYNYKQTYHVELPSVCKDDLICLSNKQAGEGHMIIECDV